MITVKGYNPVDYDTFQGVLFDAYKRSKKTYFQISKEIDVRSTQTSANALTSNKQKLSDQMLTKVMAALDVKGFILTTEGTKYYYIKQN